MPEHTHRVALWMPVAELSEFLAQASKLGRSPEHVYDD